jgi:hypothetical protein
MRTAARILSLAVLAGCAGAAHAATLVRDLGQGLWLYRVHELPADLPTPASPHPAPCIVDLRYAKAGELDASVLRAWIKVNASARTPIFVLENSGTSAPLLASMARGAAGLVVLAPESDQLRTDVAVKVTPGSDRSAYDALEKGAGVDSLLLDYPDKPRVDEAFLEKERLPDSESPEPAADKPRPLVDAMLQAAVHLHRGLVALKRT